MSLIMCKCCRREISENASSCPYCGEPIKYDLEEKQKAVKENVRTKVAGFFVGLIIFIIVFILLYNWISPKFDEVTDGLLNVFGFLQDGDDLIYKEKSERQTKEDFMNWIGFDKIEK